MKQSGLLRRQRMAEDARLSAVQTMVLQFSLDTLAIAVAESEGFGYSRVMRLLKHWREVRMRYQKALDARDVEADVAREHMDRALKAIAKGNQDIMPFEQRYPELRKVTYDKRR